MTFPYKIKCTSVGVSTDLFTIMYSIVGNSTLYLADAICGGGPATLVTGAQLISGYAALFPANVGTIYVYNMSGDCVDRFTAVTLA